MSQFNVNILKIYCERSGNIFKKIKLSLSFDNIFVNDIIVSLRVYLKSEGIMRELIFSH